MGLFKLIAVKEIKMKKTEILMIQKEQIERASEIFGGNKGMADALNVSRQLIYRWQKDVCISVEMALNIEAITKNKVSRYDLLPHLFDEKTRPDSKTSRKQSDIERRTRLILGKLNDLREDLNQIVSVNKRT